MDIPTRNLGKYVRDKGINVTNLAKSTGISYWALYNSLLNPEKNRDLRLGEALSVCAFLGIDPMDFTDEPEDRMQEGRRNVGT